jgi:WD40 repeat protein
MSLSRFDVTEALNFKRFSLFLSAFIAMPLGVTLADMEKPAAVFEFHKSRLLNIRILDNAATLSPAVITVDQSGKILFWDVPTQRIGWESQLGDKSESRYAYIAASEDQRIFSVLRQNSPVNVYSTITGAVIQTIKIPAGADNEWWITGDFSPDNRRFVISSVNGDLRMFDVESGLQTAAVIAPPPEPGAEDQGGFVSFSSDGRFLILDGEQLTIYDAVSLKFVKSVSKQHLNITSPSAFSKNMRVIAFANSREIFIIDAETLSVIHTIENAGAASGISLFTAAIHFDSRSSNLYVLHAMESYPFSGYYEVIDIVTGRKRLSTRISSAILALPLSEGYFSLPISIGPGGAFAMTGGKNPSSVSIWNLPLPEQGN